MKILTTQKTETHRKYSQHNQKQKTTGNTHNTTKTTGNTHNTSKTESTANTHNTTKYRKAPQILTTQPNTEKHCKYSQHNQKQKSAEILTTQAKKHCKYNTTKTEKHMRFKLKV